MFNKYTMDSSSNGLLIIPKLFQLGMINEEERDKLKGKHYIFL